MPAQNLLDFGFNLKEFQSEADQILAIVKKLHADLKEFDNAKISPISISGLSELTKATQAQQQQTANLTKTVSELSLAMTAYNNMASQTAKIDAQIAASSSEEARALAAKKVQLQEINKALLDEAKANNASVQSRKTANEQKALSDAAYVNLWKTLLAEQDAAEAASKAEKEAADREYVALWKSLLAEQDAQEAASIKTKQQLRSQATADELSELQLIDQERKANDARFQASEKQKTDDAVAASNFRKQLLLEEKRLEAAIGTALGQGAPRGGELITGLKAQLSDTRKAIKTIDDEIGKTGQGGVARFGRELGHSLGFVRQLAYILPGIGMAGIFNLAFEAITKVWNALTDVNAKVVDISKSEKELNSTLMEQIDLWQQINKLNSQAWSTQIGSAKDLQSLANLYGAQGQNQITQLNAQIIAADQNLSEIEKRMIGTPESIKARINSYSVKDSEGNTILEHNKKEYEAAKGVADAYDYLKSIGISRNAEIRADLHLSEVGAENLRQSLELKGYNPTQINQVFVSLDKIKEKLTTSGPYAKMLPQFADAESVRAYSEQLKSTYDLSVKEYADDLTSYTEYNDAKDKAAQLHAQKAKFLDDEARKERLSNAQKTYEDAQLAEKKVLDNQLSTQAERVKAIQDFNKASDAYALAQLNNVLTNISHSGSEEVEAYNRYNEAIAKNNQEANQNVAKVDLEYWQKHHEELIKALEEEIRIHQVADKTIMDNEQASFEDRILAQSKYNEDRRQAAIAQYNSDIETMRQTVSPDLWEDMTKDLTNTLNSKLEDVSNDIRTQSYNIATSWGDEQIKAIKDNNEDQINTVKDGQTDKLLAIEDGFAKGKLSYKKYNEELKQQNYQGQLDIDQAQIKALEADLDQFTTVKQEFQKKSEGEIMLASLAGNQDQFDQALGNYQGFQKEIFQTDKNINQTRSELADARLRYATDAEKNEMDARKQTAENWKKFEEDMFKDIKEVGDSYYEDRINQIERLTEAQDKAADAEIAAIQRSTLAAKDKNAYEVQLQAEKAQRDKNAQKEERKLKHDEAVFNKAVDMAQIIISTEVAIAGALASVAYGVPLPVATAEAISFGALGAASLATAAATKIPSYAEGGTHKKDGLALFGEAGNELVKEPGMLPYIAKQPTIKPLKAGTELIPLYEIPTISENRNDSWAQTLYLGKQIAKSKREIKNIFKPKIQIDLNLELYKQKIIHG